LCAIAWACTSQKNSTAIIARSSFAALPVGPVQLQRSQSLAIRWSRCATSGLAADVPFQTRCRPPRGT
jgi:hypothetical protein